MNPHTDIEHLEKRVRELENLAWSLFRALETYVTFNESPTSRERLGETHTPNMILAELSDVLERAAHHGVHQDSGES